MFQSMEIKESKKHTPTMKASRFGFITFMGWLSLLRNEHHITSLFQAHIMLLYSSYSLSIYSIMSIGFDVIYNYIGLDDTNH